MAKQTYEGGCLCGAVRYRATGTPHRPHYCHCRMCRLAVGAPLTAWVNFPLGGFTYLVGEPAYHRSSPDLRRGFRRSCGASICTIADGDDYAGVTLASLDEPGRISPALHMWTSSQVSWLEVDELPRHQGQA